MNKSLLWSAILTIIFVIPAFSQQDSSQQQNNKKLVLLIFNEGINNKNLSVFDKWYKEDVIDHSAFPGQVPGLEGLKNAVKYLYEALPNVKVKVEDIIADGNLVATRESWTSKKKDSDTIISGWVLHIFKFKDGKVSEEWSKGWEWLSN